MNNILNPIITVKEETKELPIDLAIIKNFLKVDFDEDDELITKMLKTAINQCETYISKTLIEKTYIYSLYNLKNLYILLPFSPIKEIISITVNKIDGNKEILNTDFYILDDIGSIIKFKNKIENFYRLDIEYKAGSSNINDDLVQAILMHIARMYEDRSGYSPIPTNSINIYRKYKQIKL